MELVLRPFGYQLQYAIDELEREVQAPNVGQKEPQDSAAEYRNGSAYELDHFP